MTLTFVLITRDKFDRWVRYGSPVMISNLNCVVTFLCTCYVQYCAIFDRVISKVYKVQIKSSLFTQIYAHFKTSVIHMSLYMRSSAREAYLAGRPVSCSFTFTNLPCGTLDKC